MVHYQFIHDVCCWEGRPPYLSTTRQKLISFWLLAPTAPTPLASLDRGKPISCSWRHRAASSTRRLARQDSSSPGPGLAPLVRVWSWSSWGHGVQFSRPVAPREVGRDEEEDGDFFFCCCNSSTSFWSSEIISPMLLLGLSSPLLGTLSLPSFNFSVLCLSLSEETLLTLLWSGDKLLLTDDDVAVWDW